MAAEYKCFLMEQNNKYHKLNARNKELGVKIYFPPMR